MRKEKRNYRVLWPTFFCRLSPSKHSQVIHEIEVSVEEVCLFDLEVYNLNVRSLNDYHRKLTTILETISKEHVERFVNHLIKARDSNRKILICGNGGSASTADHFAVDLGVGSLMRGSGFVVIPLTASASAITAIGNDSSFEHVFATQVQLYGEPGDLLIVISASGKSRNLIKAVEAAKVKSMGTVALLGFDGGTLMDLVDLAVLAKSELGEYGLVEDAHLSLTHYVTERVRFGK
jgi:D-sedoheptulose 7-phosphate isomerase